MGSYRYLKVTEAVYESCDTSLDDPVHVYGEPSVDSTATIADLTTGTYYFICSGGHCDAGMKIKVQWNLP